MDLKLAHHFCCAKECVGPEKNERKKKMYLDKMLLSVVVALYINGGRDSVI
jgi:hypothetical protein